MADGDAIYQVAVVILLLALAVPALATAYDYAGTPFAYEETTTVDYGNTTNVSQNATIEGYSENITIYDDDNGKNLTEGEDYEWNPDTGEITWLSTANTNDGDNVTVWYDAYQRTGESELAWTLISPFMALFGLFGLTVSIRALIRLVSEVFSL